MLSEELISFIHRMEGVNRQIFFAISLVAAFTAIYLVQRHSHPSIGSYRHVLSFLVFINVIFAVVNYFSNLTVHVTGHWVVLAGVEGIKSETLSLLSVHSLIFVFFENVLLVTAQIFHRWLIICKKVSTRNSLAVAIWLGMLAHVLLLGWMALWMKSLVTTTQCIHKLNDKVYEIIHHDNEGVLLNEKTVGCDDFVEHLELEHDLAQASFLAIRFEEFDVISESWRPAKQFVVLLSLLCLGLLLSLLLIIHFTILILHRVRRDLRYVERGDHTQIVRALVLQAAVPCAFLHVPLFASATLTAIYPKFELLFRILPFTTAWFPALQSTALITSVASYRRALYRICFRKDEPLSKRRPLVSPSIIPGDPSSIGGLSIQTHIRL
ncbi:unnamed protein product, partial [Mesorhabditis belari]|uniref:G protein-coupled receptor n=1 Tax=Mesorhabditis belari TaxID=2138241 RepID=A0AAF3FFJ2_9BILA